MSPDHLRRADAIEIVVGQGAKPGGGGMLLGSVDVYDEILRRYVSGSGVPLLAVGDAPIIQLRRFWRNRTSLVS